VLDWEEVETSLGAPRFSSFAVFSLYFSFYSGVTVSIQWWCSKSAAFGNGGELFQPESSALLMVGLFFAFYTPAYARPLASFGSIEMSVFPYESFRMKALTRMKSGRKALN